MQAMRGAGETGKNGSASEEGQAAAPHRAGALGEFQHAAGQTAALHG